MKERALSYFQFLSFVTLIFILPLFAQDENEDLRFKAALNSYVNQLLTDFGKDAIHHERFLVQQIRMLNDEIKSRVSNVSEIRNNYFQRLQSRVVEIRELRQRLNVSGLNQLNEFVDELEDKIQQTIASGCIDFKRQKVIEDAIQLLYIAEEMIKLDPNSRLEDNSKFVKGLSETKNDFVQSFGEDVKWKRKTTSAGAGSGSATIFDVYREWRKTERIKYQLRWTDVQIIKNRLIKNATFDEKSMMFKRELFHAAEMFNFGYYDLAERSFEEILTRYDFINNLEDCLYYQAESNYILGRYNRAKDIFTQLVQRHPSSSFVGLSYKRLMHIAYHFDNHAQVLEYLRKMRAIVSSSDPVLEEVLMLAVISGLKGGFYEEAVSCAYEIPSTSEYYRQSRFVLAEAYVGAQNFEEAVNIFKSLLQISGLRPNFRFTILLKLGYLSYETGDFQGAISYFDQIAGAFPRYDRVLIGYGWSYYKMELEKALLQKRDFTFAKKYLEALIDIFYSSDYLLEAKTLLGYIYQLETNPNLALNNYEYSFKAKDVKLLSDELNSERDQMREILKTANKLEKKALTVNDVSAFHRAYAIKQRIKQPLIELSYSDLSSTGVATKNEILRLNKQLSELERLKGVAKERGSKELVNRIEDMQLRIYRAVNSIPVQKTSKLGINYFDEHPFARKESVIESENAKISMMRSEATGQRAEIIQRIAQLDVEIQNARTNKDYRKMIHLELNKERFEDLAKKFDFLETQAYSFDIKSSNINLNKWSDYGAFGMANVNFAIKNIKTDEMDYMQKQIGEINKFLDIRKENLEHKIELINSEITMMTRRVREQERRREREELERQFKDSYFDTHDTELDYNPDTTNIPKIENETDQ